MNPAKVLEQLKRLDEALREPLELPVDEEVVNDQMNYDF